MDEPLFIRAHRIGRSAESLTGAGFDFDKSEHVSMATNNIHLAALWCAEIAVKHPSALRAQPTARKLLAQESDLGAGSGHASIGREVGFAERQARTSGDGSDKGREA